MPRKAPRRPAKTAPQEIEVIDPRWIVWTVALIVAASVLCGYLTLCYLFYQGQWQLVLHPSPKVDATPASLGLAFTPMHFAVDETGQPTLTGWFIHAGQSPAPTILFLHDGDTTMSAALPRIQQLHDLGFDVLIFDYRGYGASKSLHPSQQTMQQDAERALAWLTVSHQLPAAQIIPYGVGVGAPLAVHLSATHPEVRALILESPRGDLAPIIAKDERTKFIPLHLLFHNDFPLAAPLSTLPTPKLLLTSADADLPLYRAAAGPKRIAEFPAADNAAFTETLRRFAEEYLPSSAPVLSPSLHK